MAWSKRLESFVTRIPSLYIDLVIFLFIKNLGFGRIQPGDSSATTALHETEASTTSGGSTISR